MNFFEHQDRAKSQSRKLLWLLSLTILVIIVAVDTILLLVAGVGANIYLNPYHLLQADLLAQHWKLLTGGALATTICIGLASLYKITSLRAGGGKVARDLGGVLLDFDTSDPARRRLRNVVEEMALASGMPVPDIYILETESSINAFAAGYSMADAVIVVTRGTVEQLQRNELQGVIAHEFSHIINGDMRLNIRMMGLLYGIMVLAIIGRTLFGSSHGYSRHHYRRRHSNHSLSLAGAGLISVGYIGVLMTRAIKASISRQREYLADASAVQFTRDTSGISGALQKIAANPLSELHIDSEEISHMLFETGKTPSRFLSSRYLASHPPILERIKRIEPSFRPSQLQAIAAKQNKAARQIKQADSNQTNGNNNLHASQPSTSSGFVDTTHIINQIGQPPAQTILYAANLAAALPQTLKSAAHSTHWAPLLVLALLLDKQDDILHKQRLMIAKTLGAEAEQQLNTFNVQVSELTAEQRLPMLELALPALKRQPADYLQRYLTTVEQLIHADGRIDVFEYVCAKLLGVYLDDAQHAASASMAGKLSILQCQPQVSELLLMLAWKGHQSKQQVQAAYQQGLNTLNLKHTQQLRLDKNWQVQLDKALSVLDQLNPQAKQALIKAMLSVCWYDQRMQVSEAELLRAVAAALHVPLSMLNNIESKSTEKQIPQGNDVAQTLQLRA